MSAKFSVDELFQQGVAHFTAGNAVAAETAFRAALDIDPSCAEAMANVALLRERDGDIVQAESCYRRALALNPSCVTTHLNLGVLLLNGKRFADAEALVQAALRLAPDSPVAWSNYGVLQACQKREVQAEQCYRTAMALDPEYAKARFNLAYVLLRQGRFGEGWECLEARDWYAPLARYFQCPRWQGESLQGEAVIVGIEAGYGDMIQFCRYLPLLKVLGATRVALVCHQGLKTLLATLDGVDQIFSLEDDVPAAGWDFWSPPLSLPHYLRTTLETIPAGIPYLHPDPQRVAQWRARLPASGLRVGLVWKGNPLFENDADRSLPSLATLLPLSQVPGVSFVSLQKGAGEAEALDEPPPFSLIPVGGELQDFADTAAVVACLDLVISVDTAVAHLAGALGKACWVLLPDYKTDWRWLAGREDSPWYPEGMRLFRQASGESWGSVIERLTEALAAWSAARMHHSG